MENAETADRHELYELSVQNVEGEVELVQQFSQIWEKGSALAFGKIFAEQVNFRRLGQNQLQSEQASNRYRS